MPAMKLAFQGGRSHDDQGLKTTSDLIGASDKKVNQYRVALELHGVVAEQIKDELVGNCIFHDCPSFIEGQTNKFTMNTSTTQWRCFRCGRQGNMTNFIREVHRNSLEQTTEDHLHQLAELRHHAIDVREFRELQIALNPVTGEWSIPSRSLEGKISNLYVWQELHDVEKGTPYRTIRATASLAQLPYCANRVRQGVERPIIVAEGHFDTMAWMTLLFKVEQTGLFDVIGSPGAFPEKYLKIFNGRRVMLFGDNDKAGESIMDGIIIGMKQKGVMPISVSRMQWPKDLPQKFDVSDAILKLPKPLRKKAAK